MPKCGEHNIAILNIMSLTFCQKGKSICQWAVCVGATTTHSFEAKFLSSWKFQSKNTSNNMKSVTRKDTLAQDNNSPIRPLEFRVLLYYSLSTHMSECTINACIRMYCIYISHRESGAGAWHGEYILVLVAGNCEAHVLGTHTRNTHV